MLYRLRRLLALRGHTEHDDRCVRDGEAWPCNTRRRFDAADMLRARDAAL